MSKRWSDSGGRDWGAVMKREILPEQRVSTRRLTPLRRLAYALLAPLLLGSVPGIWLGAQLTRKLPDGLLRGALCASLVTAGVKVIH